MEERLQRRVQRYGWDRAAPDYEPLWQRQLAAAHSTLLAVAQLVPGERVLDVACGTGLVTVAAARAVGPRGCVLGVDLSGTMIQVARERAAAAALDQISFARMDAEALSFPDASLDVALCALGLMYPPCPQAALREMRRVLRPGGRMVSAVWGERRGCGWAAIFDIVAAEVKSEVCPLFFRLGQADTLARHCVDARFEVSGQWRLVTTLDYADGTEACNAALAGGPVALAWSRFDAATRTRVQRRYLEALEPWRSGGAYAVPAEFLVVAGRVPQQGVCRRD